MLRNDIVLNVFVCVWMDRMHAWIHGVHGVCVRLRGGERSLLRVCVGVHVLMRVCVRGFGVWLGCEGMCMCVSVSECMVKCVCVDG